MFALSEIAFRQSGLNVKFLVMVKLKRQT